MICPHCQEEVETIQVHQKVDHRQDLIMIDGRPHLEIDVAICFPRGAPALVFRCGACGGLLPERDCASLLRQARKR